MECKRKAPKKGAISEKNEGAKMMNKYNHYSSIFQQVSDVFSLGKEVRNER